MRLKDRKIKSIGKYCTTISDKWLTWRIVKHFDSCRLLGNSTHCMNIWQEVKERLAIEEVIGEYVPVQPAGRNFRCLSPFRQERTPSLIISPEKKIWHDFGSGEGGDVFEFVARMENISRFEALQKLAQKVGIVIASKPDLQNVSQGAAGTATSWDQKAQPTTEVSKYQRGLAVLQWAAKIYHKILLKALQDRANPITKYCLQRGLSPEIVEVFALGYAPRDNFLLHLAERHTLDLELLYEVGLLKKADHNKADANQKALYQDKFRDRLMIPIKNFQGKVVGFTGRVLPYDKTDRPKYLNSPQTDWFNKSRIWYGLDLNRQQLVQRRTALIVEGNMDVITAYRCGLRYALASQGTSFTAEQLKILKNYVDTLHLAFDNDEAGQLASKKLFVEATRLGFAVKKVVIPEPHKDLDEYLTKLTNGAGGAANVPTLPVVSYFDWLLDQKSLDLGGDDTERQRTAVLEVLELLAVSDNITIEQYAGKLAKLTGLTKAKLLTEVERLQKHSKNHLTRLDSLSDDNFGQAINSNAEILQSWQLLMACHLFSRQQRLSVSAAVLENMYNLLREFFTSLAQAENFQEYLSLNQSLFELIWEQKQSEITETYITVLEKSILWFLDQKVETFLFDQNKYLLYSKIKGLAI